MIISYYYYNRKANRKEKLPTIKTISAIEAINEGIGRAIEQNKPVHFEMGAKGGQLYSQNVGLLTSALEILKYTTKICARLESKIIVHMPGQSESIPLVESIVRDALMTEGMSDMTEITDLRYYGFETVGFLQAVVSSYENEGVGLNIFVGQCYSEAFPILESAMIRGALCIGGTAAWEYTLGFALMTDHILLGEELYAAGALVSEDPVMISSIASTDIGKYFMLIVAFVSVLLIFLSVDIVKMFSY
jgi:hypothetical protein